MENEDIVVQMLIENPRSLKDLSVALGLGKIETLALLETMSLKIKAIKFTSFNGKGRPVVSTRYETK